MSSSLAALAHKCSYLAVLSVKCSIFTTPTTPAGTHSHVTDATVLAAIGNGETSQLKHLHKRKNYERFHEIITQLLDG